MRSLLSVFASLLLCGIAFSEIRAQPISYGSCTRHQFEMYFAAHPEQNKAPVIQFFDNARRVADDSVKLLIAGQIDELHSSMSPFAKALSVDKFREYLAHDEQRDGKIVDYKFVGQNLLFSGPSDLHLQDGGLLISHYSVKTTKWEDHTYLLVWTLGVKSTPMLQGIEMDHYGSEFPDPYENAVWKTTGVPACSSIRGTLKISP